MSIKGYQHYFTPTESNKGGVISYIAEQHNCKPRKDLDAISYKTYGLQSVFTEIIISKRSPSMEIKDFNENYLNPLMDKLGDKNVFLLGDFNIDLMKNDIDTHTSTFLDIKSICSSYNSPYTYHFTIEKTD